MERQAPFLLTPSGEVLNPQAYRVGVWDDLENGDYEVFTTRRPSGTQPDPDGRVIESELVEVACPDRLNHKPVGVSDTIGNGNESLPYQIVFPLTDLLANDLDSDGDPLTITSVITTNVLRGTISIVDGIATYERPDDPWAFCLPNDSMDYIISDGLGGVAGGRVHFDIVPFDPYCGWY